MSSNKLKSKNKTRIDEFFNFLKERKKEEDDRRKTIETKAHSLIGQTSIAITLLLALISVVIYALSSVDILLDNNLLMINVAF